MYKLASGVTVDVPVFRKSYQLQATLAHPDMTTPQIFSAALTCASAWLQRKFAEMDNATEKLSRIDRSFSLEFGAVSVHVVCDTESMQWACRYVQPDNEIAARTWTTQISFYERNGSIHADILNICISAKSSDTPVPLTTPGIVRALQAAVDIIAGVPLSGKPLEIRDYAGIDSLYAMLTDPQRQLPVVVVSAVKEPGPAQYLVDLHGLSGRCFSIATVVALTCTAAELWKNRVGTLWAVFDGAIRTYLPGVDFEDGDMFQHPLLLRQSILNRKQQYSSEREFVQWFSFLTRTKNIQHSADNAKLYLYQEMNQSLLERRRKEFEHRQQNASETMELYKLELQTLQETVSDLEIQKRSLESDLLELQCEMDEQNGTIYRLQSRIDTLLAWIREREQGGIEVMPYPDSLGELSEWCATHFSGRLILSSKAKRAAKKAEYQDIPLIYRVLEVLGRDYRDMRLGICTREAYFERLQALGVRDEGPPISPSRLGEMGDTYYFNYQNEKVLMESHIRKGVSRDPCELLAIYFSWHDASKQVLIGSLPGHLDTRDSN